MRYMRLVRFILRMLGLHYEMSDKEREAVQLEIDIKQIIDRYGNDLRRVDAIIFKAQR